ncbi:hypothetical protein, partial [Escherichia coli]|uniref:hypothetical protein n=1 Tax=Escherichia coli TaxID=562 RepID=UPI00280B5FA2
LRIIGLSSPARTPGYTLKKNGQNLPFTGSFPPNPAPCSRVHSHSPAQDSSAPFCGLFAG